MMADLDFPWTQGKTMHKNLLGLIASPSSIQKQYQCSSTHMSNTNMQNDMPDPFRHIHPRPPATHLQTGATAMLPPPSPQSLRPSASWSSERGESGFFTFFSSSKGGRGLKQLVSLIKEQCKAFTLLQLKIKLIFHHAFIGGIQDSKRHVAHSKVGMRQESGKKKIQPWKSS